MKLASATKYLIQSCSSSGDPQAQLYSRFLSLFVVRAGDCSDGSPQHHTENQKKRERNADSDGVKHLELAYIVRFNDSVMPLIYAWYDVNTADWTIRGRQQ